MEAIHMTSSIFSANEFWPSFTEDLSQARAHVIIQSPFVGNRRLKLLSKKLRQLTTRGVAICAFLQQPQNWTSKPTEIGPEAAFFIQEFRLAIDMLASWNIHVNIRPKIHGKLAIIDDNILWEGSLNILSHYNTEEHMRRWESMKEARATIQKHLLTDCYECMFNSNGYGINNPNHLLGLGRLLSIHRNSLKMSQREFAQHCGVPHTRIAQIERGRNITAQTLFRITDRLKLKMLLVPEHLTPPITNFVRQNTSTL
jgi:DNA-binding XRE family transcriptional regulator